MSAPFLYSGMSFFSNWRDMYGTAGAKASFEELIKTGANSITLSSNIYISSPTASDFHSWAGSTEPLESIRAMALEAHSRGLSVMLKPHIETPQFVSRSTFAPSDPAAWFAGYKALLLDYAKVAQETKSEILCIGCELTQLSGANYKSYWLDIIDSIRAVYSGKLTYAADFTELKTVSFLDKLDIIGVDAYVPLSNTTSPTIEDLVRAWTEPPTNYWLGDATDQKSAVEFYHDISVQYGKPIMFTEIGYRSIDGGTKLPGLWSSTGAVDVQEQADAYQALMTVWTRYGGDWFAGMQLWAWSTSPVPADPLDFSPQGKPSEGIITGWYTGAQTTTGLFNPGTPINDVLDGGIYADTLSGGAGSDLLRGGRGADLLVGDGTAPTTTTIVVKAQAFSKDAFAAQLKILVDGKQVGATFTAGSDIGTFTVTLPGNVVGKTIGVAFLNGGNGKSLLIRDIAVNGVHLEVGDAINPSGNGTWSMWFSSTLSYDLSSRPEIFSGAQRWDDTLVGGAGNDTLVGGQGNDTAVYSGSLSDYDIAVDSVSGALTLVDHRTGSPDGTDLVTGIEWFQFRDGTVSSATLLAGIVTGTVPPPPPPPSPDPTPPHSPDPTTAPADTICGSDKHDNLAATGGQVLLGLAGNDTLTSLHGMDTLVGGLGNDTYLVTTGDVIVEQTGEGTDTVRSGVTWVLGDNLEKLVLTGSDAINATGNSLNNSLTGNSAANVLDGGGGNDTMAGAGGNDTYMVDSTGDRVVEAANAGIDTVISTIDYKLTANVENLTLVGTAPLRGTGNSLSNVIIGNDGNNVIDGASGSDTLDGGAGNDVIRGGTGDDVIIGGAGIDQMSGGKGSDVFVFNAVTDSPAGTGRDAISDFTRGQDKIDLSAIDADLIHDGHQSYLFVGANAFSGTAGELRFSSGLLQADANGDGVADVEIAIRLTSGSSLSLSDFRL